MRKAVSFAGMKPLFSVLTRAGALSGLALPAVLLLAALVQGCGYQLRGQALQVKAQAQARTQDGYQVHVSAAAGPLADTLTSQLVVSGIRLADGIKDADYVLTLSGEKFERQVVSVSPATGKVEEYLIVFSVRISISDAGGKDLVLGQLVRASGDYAFDEDAALGKFSEEETIREELLEQVAAQIIRRLNTLVN